MHWWVPVSPEREGMKHFHGTADQTQALGGQITPTVKSP